MLSTVFGILNIKFATLHVPATMLNALCSPALLCALGSRIFFKLKEAAENGVNVGTNWSSYSHSAIRSGIRFEHEHDGEER